MRETFYTLIINKMYANCNESQTGGKKYPIYLARIYSEGESDMVWVIFPDRHSDCYMFTMASPDTSTDIFKKSDVIYSLKCSWKADVTSLFLLFSKDQKGNRSNTLLNKNPSKRYIIGITIFCKSWTVIITFQEAAKIIGCELTPCDFKCRGYAVKGKYFLSLILFEIFFLSPTVQKTRNYINFPGNSVALSGIINWQG